MDREKLWQSLNSDLSRLIVGFVLTTVIGGLLTQWYQDRNWLRQSQFEYEKRQLDEAQKFVEKLSTSVSLHLWNTREMEILLTTPSLFTEADTERIWAAFKETRNKWYMDLPVNQSKANLLLAPGMKELLRANNETSTDNLSDPKSLAGFFAVAEQDVTKMMNCMRQKPCQPTTDDINRMRANVDRLEQAATQFMEQASNLVYHKAVEIEPLKSE
ncbi:MAG: hypothetical protein EA001_05465 [Oscillatoriales cyanobacterium]|nr:MAG: hypothetical protein EA001_05465 [Oscillatoriales cyanobacterium]